LKTIGKSEKKSYLPMQTPNPYDNKNLSGAYLTPNSKFFVCGESSSADLKNIFMQKPATNSQPFVKRDVPEVNQRPPRPGG